MLHTKFLGNRSTCSGKENILKVFTIYGHVGHLGHVTWTIYTNFCYSIPMSLHMKFGFDWPSGFRRRRCLEIVDNDDGRRSNGIL